MNGLAGQVTLHPPPAPPALPGGILGDEMGLGKTAEMHALMVARPRPWTPPVHPCAPDSDPKSLPASGCAPSATPNNDIKLDSESNAHAERRWSGKHTSSTKSDEQTGNACRVSPGTTHDMVGVGSERRHPTRLVLGHNLVVCPLQLKDQWINEVRACCSSCWSAQSLVLHGVAASLLACLCYIQCNSTFLGCTSRVSMLQFWRCLPQQVRHAYLGDYVSVSKTVSVVDISRACTHVTGISHEHRCTQQCSPSACPHLLIHSLVSSKTAHCPT